MGRYTNIESASFGQTALSLPLSVRLSRQCRPNPARGDNDVFDTNVEISDVCIVAEVRLRDTAVAEGLLLGQQDTLSAIIAPAETGESSRTVTLTGAVLVAVELSYEQTAMATALLRFTAESSDGQTDPFGAEDSQ